MSPKDKDVIIHDGSITLQGWGYSGNGNWVERVEVSPDGGHVWYACKPEDLTQKVYSIHSSSRFTPRSGILSALSRVAALEDRGTS